MTRRLAPLVLAGLISIITSGCSQHAAVNTPSEAKLWLSEYFQALKSKNTAKIEDLACAMPTTQTEQMGAQGAEFMRTSRKQMADQLVERIQQLCGDFNDYSIDSCTVTHLSDSSSLGQFLGAGKVIDIMCKSSYSKKNVNERFAFFEADEGDHELSLQKHEIQ